MPKFFRVFLFFFFQEAYNHVLRCCRTVRPNRGFIEQLSKWEQVLNEGNKLTDIADPNF